MASSPLSSVLSDIMPDFLLQSGFSASWGIDNLKVTRVYDGRFYTNIGANNPYKTYRFSEIILTQAQFTEFLEFWNLVKKDKVFWFIDPFDNFAQLTGYSEEEASLGFYTRGGLFAENTYRGTGTGFDQPFQFPDSVVPVKIYAIYTTRGHKYYCKPIYRLNETEFRHVPGGYENATRIRTNPYTPIVDFTDPDDYLITNIPYTVISATNGGGFNGQRLEPAEFNFYTPLRFTSVPSYTQEVAQSGEIIYRVSGLTAVETFLPVPGYPKSGFGWYPDENYNLGDSAWNLVNPKNFDTSYAYPMAAGTNVFGFVSYSIFAGDEDFGVPQWSIFNSGSNPTTGSEFYSNDLIHVFVGTKSYLPNQTGHNFSLPHLLTYATTQLEVLEKKAISASGLVEIESRDSGTKETVITNQRMTSLELQYMTALAYCTHFGGSEFVLDTDYVEFVDIEDLGIPMVRFRELTQTVEISEDNLNVFTYSTSFTLDNTGYGNLSLNINDVESVERGTESGVDDVFPVTSGKKLYEGLWTDVGNDHIGRRVDTGLTVATEEIEGRADVLNTRSFTASAASDDLLVFFSSILSGNIYMVRYDFASDRHRLNAFPPLIITLAHIYKDKIYYVNSDNLYVFDRFAGGERPFASTPTSTAVQSHTVSLNTSGENIAALSTYRDKLYIFTANGTVYVGDGCDWHNLYTLTLSGTDIISALVYANKIWALTTVGMERHDLTTGAFEDLITQATSDFNLILHRCYNKIFVVPRYDNILISNSLSVYDVVDGTHILFDSEVEALSTGRGVAITGLGRYAVSEGSMLRIDTNNNRVLIRFNFRGNNITTAATQVLAISEGVNEYRFASDLDMPIPNFYRDQMPDNTLAGVQSAGQIEDTSLTASSQEIKADFSPNNSQVTVSRDFLPNLDASGAGQPYYTAYILTLDRRYLGDHNFDGFIMPGILSILYTIRGTIGDLVSADNEKITVQIEGEEIYWTKEYTFKTSSTCQWLYGGAECGQVATTRTHLVSPQNSTTDPYTALMISASDPNAPDVPTIGAFTYGTVTFESGRNQGLTIPIARIYTGSNVGQAFGWKARPAAQTTNPGNVNIDLLYAPPFPVADDTSITLTEGCFRTQEACNAKANFGKFSGFSLVPGVGKYSRGPADKL